MARKKKNFFRKAKFTQKTGIVLIVLLSIYIIGCIIVPDKIELLFRSMGFNQDRIYYSYDMDKIPEYDGRGYVILNNNIPDFKKEEITTDSFEIYSDLDSLGRCGVAYANISKELMPTDERGSIGSVKPSGWHTIKYNNIVDGNYLYNRCHLIGYQLSGENANPNNLITCTRQMNTMDMLDFENKVTEYVKRTNNHVLYRVTPVFKDMDLVAHGVIIEAYSVEDHGKGIKFNVFVYNVQDKIEIDYKDGTSKLVQ